MFKLAVSRAAWRTSFRTVRNVKPIIRSSGLNPLSVRSSLALGTLVRRFHVTSHCRDDSEDSADKSKHLGSVKVDKPMLMIAFTCKVCGTRSSHTMSKQAYTKGSVLIKCPGCNNRHLIADHLNIFSDDHVTVEDIMKAKGESVSLTTDDLAFEDVPDTLKDVIGHYAKDAPEHYKQKLDNEKIHHLPEGEK